MIRTVSLETAKLLKEAGFPQHYGDRDRFFYSLWTKINQVDLSYGQKRSDDNSVFAPTTDELLAELPWRIKVLRQSCDLLITKGPKNYSVRYVASYDFPKRSGATPVVNESLSEALAKTWIGLKKEGLLK